MLAVHRIVEAHAATRGDEVAVVGADGVLTFRELNFRANALARYLIDQGLRRGSRAVVKMERSPDLTIVLLAVLKAGAAYTWVALDEDDAWPIGVSVVRQSADEVQPPVVVGVDDAMQASLRAAPNLPILTRGHDIACVMQQRGGRADVLVPHATIAALLSCPLPAGRWVCEPGALDIWIPLMAGAAVALTEAVAPAAA